jgi:hypothetical protein
MPRCHSCGTFVKKPHREVDGRTERAYCDLCHAEREWRFGDDRATAHPEGVPPPPLNWWQRLKLRLGLA